MKRVIAAVTVICLLFGGCGVIKENNEAGEPVPVSVLDLSSNEFPGRVEKNSAIYFLNKVSDALTADPRTLVIGQDTNPADVAVQKLLEGPSNDDLQSVAPEGMSLDYIEYSRDVANVYLLYDGEEMLLKERYILEIALANTITDILGASYICVFYNGVQAGYHGAPCAPQQKQTGSIEDAWLQADTTYQNEVPVVKVEQEQPVPTMEPEPLAEYIEPETIVSSISTVLYFISANGGYILPEVRIVKYTNGNYIAALVAELQIGPQNTSIMTSPLADDVELDEPELIKNGDGTYTLKLNFSEIPTQYDDSDAKDTLLSYAAMIYTLTGFIPNIDTVDIYVKGTRITSIDGAADFIDGLQRNDFTGYIGSSAPLYFEDEDSDLLLEVTRSMEQGQIWSAKARVLELIAIGPLLGDVENVEAIARMGMTEQDILSVDVYADTAYVDLSQNFKDVCTGLSSKTEMQIVYSIVNTLTAMDGITKVQLLVEGQQTDTLAGNLCIADPFLRNYGIIKKTG